VNISGDGERERSERKEARPSKLNAEGTEHGAQEQEHVRSNSDNKHFRVSGAPSLCLSSHVKYLIYALPALDKTLPRRFN
jgi:hypothetical protein